MCWGAGDVSAVPDLTGAGVGGYCVPNAQHAVRQGKLLAKNLIADLRGELPRQYYHKSLGAVAGLGLGITAFGDGSTIDPHEGDAPDPSSQAPALAVAAAARPAPSTRRERGANFDLSGDRALAKGWKDRARDNIAAIRLATAIEAEERAATAEEQAQLIRFTGFGASELANSVFRRPGETGFRRGWEAIGEDLQDAVGDLDAGAGGGPTRCAERLERVHTGRPGPVRRSRRGCDDPPVLVDDHPEH